jgi:hypothetical protein
MLIYRIKQTRKHLAVMNIGRGYGISTDEAMININADTVNVSVVIDAILFDPTSV